MKTFRQLVDERLETVTMRNQADEVMRAIRLGAKPDAPAHRLRGPAVAAIALLIVVATATALAVGLNYSRQYTVGRAAKQAVMDKYGLDSRAIEMFQTEKKEKDGVWTVTFTHWAEERAGVYTVTVSPDGETEASWSFDDVDPALYADGSLDASIWGAGQVKADMDAREAQNRAAMEAEETALETAEAPVEPLPTPAHVNGVRIMSVDGGEMADARLSGKEIVKAANDALMERFGISEKGLRLFSVAVNYEPETGRWTASYETDPFQSEGGWQELYEGRLGEYTLVIADTDGSVLSAEWSLAGVDEKAYTAETWGQAAAYGGQVLDWVADLLDARTPIVAKYNQDEALMHEPVSVEDNAALDQMMLDAGFPMEPHYKHVLPQEGDLSLEEAKELFYQALSEECGVTREAFEEGVYAYADLTREGDHREWYFWLQNAREQMSWSVRVNAETGEIIDLWIDPLAAGNG